MDETIYEPHDLEPVMHRASGGDDAAFCTLIEHIGERLRRMTQLMLRNYPRLRRWEQTDDVFQYALLRLHQSLGKVKPESLRAFYGLAGTQIRRTLIDLGRHYFGRAGHGANHQSDWLADSAGTVGGTVRSIPDASSGPQTLEDWVAFHEAVNRLPAEEREVFDLTWYSSQSQAEVAALLGVSIPTVQRRWQRARTMVYEALQGQAPAVEESP